MKIIKASAEIIAFTPQLEEIIERSGRVCYKSEDRITPGSATKFIKTILEGKHESVLEHGSISVNFVVDRGVSHELVRHRIASFSQESTRYVNYSKAKFGSEISVIDILGGFPDISDEIFQEWRLGCLDDEKRHMRMLELGATPQLARSKLPNSTKTEVVVTANPREWRHIFTLRCSKQAHPQMREVMIPLLAEFKIKWPALFGDLFQGEPN